MNTYKINSQNEYYTALEVAEILGLDKNTILNRCKKGYYTGAIKTQPDKTNPHGQWLIPKAEIDNPTMTRDVATLTRQITSQELQQSIEQAIAQAQARANEPIIKELAAIRKENTELKSKIEDLESKLDKTKEEQAQRSTALYQGFWELAEETRAERKARENRSFLAKLFGE